MKKFLSLVLALVMAMSLVTVSAGAKDFNDSDKISDIAYEEAVNVMSEMGIIDGYGDGNFQPQGTLTRGAAAKIIACMMLGKTTAESLGTQAAPFKDVPVGSTFAGYIAYCSESGIIDGYSDGTFRPGNTLTGFAFLKMLLTALGYDSTIEGYANNANWTVNVAGRAKQVGLLDGNDNFVGTRAATREEACLYAVNTLKATLVEYTDKGQSITINGATISTGASNATYVTSNVYDAATSIDDTWDNTTHDYTVEFAEKYQPDLRLTRDVDAFGRPSHTWTWKRVEIGSYIDQEKLVAEYTAKVTGRDLYDLLGSYVVDHDELLVTIDGVSDIRSNDAIFGANNIIKSNTDGVGDTGNGVLTQVFRDSAEGITYIAIINTYLAIATDDFDEDDDTLDVEVYAYDHRGNNPNNIKDTDVVSDMVADNEDVPVADYAEDDIMLVRIADGEILEVMDPEVVSDATLTAYSLTKHTITAAGTTYDRADTRLYDEGVLDEDYTAPENLKEQTFNIILDPYGYFIGLELNEDPDQYVFITGYDPYTKNLTSAIAEAGAIFVDGTMKNIDVKVNDTLSDWGWEPAGDPVDNTWYTYSVNSNDQYTLTPVVVANSADPTIANPDEDAFQFAWSYSDQDGKDIDKSHISLPAWAAAAGVTQQPDGNVGGVVYGNADSVYISVSTDDLDNTSVAPATATIIDGVESTTVGIQNTKMTVTPVANLNRGLASGGVYTLYGDDGYIIAVIVVGEDAAASSNYVFVCSSDANLETYSADDDEHTWTRPVIVNGEEKELVFKGDSIDYIGSNNGAHRMYEGNVYKVSYNANGEVTKAELIVNDRTANGIADIDASSLQVSDDIAEIELDNGDDIVLLALDLTDDNVPNANDRVLSTKGWTLYTNKALTNGFAIASDAKAVLVETVDGKAYDEVTYFDSKSDNVKAAIEALYDDDAISHNFNGMLYAILNDGVATSVILVDDVTRPGVNNGGSVLPTGNVPTERSGSTANVSNLTIGANGVMRATFTYNAPAYAADGAAGYDVEVYVDGAYYDTIRDGAAGWTTGVTLANGKSTRTYTSGILAYYGVDKVTFKIVNEYFNNMKVRYYDVDNKVYLDADDDFTVAPKTVAVGAGKTINFTLNTTSVDNLSYKIMQGDTVVKASAATVANAAVSATGLTITDDAYVDVMITGLKAAQEYVTLTGFNDTLGNLYSDWAGKLAPTQKVQLSIIKAGDTTKTVPAGSDVELIVKCDGSLPATSTKALKITIGDGDEFTWDIVIPNNGSNFKKTLDIKPTADMTLVVTNVEVVDVPTVTAVKLSDDVTADGDVTANETITLTVANGPVTVDPSKITGAGNSLDITVDDDGVITVTTAPTGGSGTITVAAGAFTTADGLQNVETKITVPDTGLPTIQ